jgi:O-antigen ligase
MQLGIMIWIIWDIFRTDNELKKALQAYVFGAFFSIFSSFNNFFKSNDIADRFSASGFNPNDHGLVVALGIPLAFHLALSYSNNRIINLLQLLNFAYIPLAFIAILLTGSRGATLASIPAIFYILSSLQRTKLSNKLIIIIFVLMSIFFLKPIISGINYQRLSTIDDSITAGDFGGRGYIWKITFERVLEHPILGSGSGSLFSAHNVFFSIMAETGLIGFFLFVLLLTTIVFSILQQDKMHFRLWLTVFVIWSIGAFVHNWEDGKPTWLFLTFVVISANIHKRSSKDH